MPDLTPIVIATCKSNTLWTATINGHEVIYSRSGYSRYTYDYSCDCQGFQYRRKCKHIEAAKEARCAWNAELSESNAETCPRCGGDVALVQVMV
jgi:hypothetical protein